MTNIKMPDPRFLYLAGQRNRPVDAYRFVYDIVLDTVRKLPQARHITALEVLEAFQLAVEREFGVWGRAVLAEWRLTRPAEVGEVVFELVGVGLLSADENDSSRDFEVADLELCRLTPGGTVTESVIWKGNKID